MLLLSDVYALFQYHDDQICVHEDDRVAQVCVGLFSPQAPVEIEIDITLSTSDGTGKILWCAIET